MKNPETTPKPILVRELGTEIPEDVSEYEIGDKIASEKDQSWETEEMIKTQNIYEHRLGSG